MVDKNMSNSEEQQYNEVIPSDVRREGLPSVEGRETVEWVAKPTDEDRVTILDTDIAVKNKEIGRLSALIEATKGKLRVAREALALPMLNDDPHSAIVRKERIRALQVEKEAAEREKDALAGKQKGEYAAQEIVEGRTLRENDFVIPDSDTEKVKPILVEMGIPYTLTEKTKPLQTADGKGTVPGEYILTVFDPDRPGDAPSGNIIKKIFAQIAERGVVVRYGKVPGSET